MANVELKRKLEPYDWSAVKALIEQHIRFDDIRPNSAQFRRALQLLIGHNIYAPDCPPSGRWIENLKMDIADLVWFRFNRDLPGIVVKTSITSRCEMRAVVQRHIGELKTQWGFRDDDANINLACSGVEIAMAKRITPWYTPIKDWEIVRDITQGACIKPGTVCIESRNFLPIARWRSESLILEAAMPCFVRISEELQKLRNGIVELGSGDAVHPRVADAEIIGHVCPDDEEEEVDEEEEEADEEEEEADEEA